MNKVAMFVMLVVSFQVSATTIECGSTDIPKLLLDDLYEYSLWAEYAFKRTKPPEVSCIVDGKEITFIAPWDVTYVKTYRVSSITLDENRVNSILKGSDLPAVAYTLKDGNGSTIDDEYYFSCFNKEVVPQLVFKVFQIQEETSISGISSAFVLVGGRDERPDRPIIRIIKRAVHTFFEVSFALPKFVKDEIINMFPEDQRDLIRSILEGEEVQAEHLHREVAAPNVVSPQAEEIYLIRGTQFNILHFLQQLRSSANEVFNETCVFRVAALVARHLSISYKADLFVVTGHSLGGAVAQFIADDQANHPDDYGANRFVGYSFNAVGLKKPQVTPIYSLYSFYIEGDPAQIGGGLSGHEQAGTAIMYIPAQGPNPLHTIRQVQRSLCKCKAGEGALDIVTRQKQAIAMGGVALKREAAPVQERAGRTQRHSRRTLPPPPPFGPYASRFAPHTQHYAGGPAGGSVEADRVATGAVGSTITAEGRLMGAEKLRSGPHRAAGKLQFFHDCNRYRPVGSSLRERTRGWASCRVAGRNTTAPSRARSSYQAPERIDRNPRIPVCPRMRCLLLRGTPSAHKATVAL